MSTVWRCSVCEAVNHGGRECAACGAVMTRRSAATTAVRGRLAPAQLPAEEPLPRPVARAINREPVVEEEWPYDDDMSYRLVPVPGGCMVVGTPRRAR